MVVVVWWWEWEWLVRRSWRTCWRIRRKKSMTTTSSLAISVRQGHDRIYLIINRKIGTTKYSRISVLVQRRVNNYLHVDGNRYNAIACCCWLHCIRIYGFMLPYNSSLDGAFLGHSHAVLKRWNGCVGGGPQLGGTVVPWRMLRIESAELTWQ